MSEFSDALRGGICGIWNSAPGRILRTPRGLPFPSNSAPLYKIFDNYCGDEPGYTPPQQVPPFAGGQCPVLYDVGFTWTVRRISSQVVSTAGVVRRLLGPVANAGTQVVGGSIAGYVNTGNGIIAGTDSFATNTWDAFTWGITTVTRVGGGADNCGNPPPEIPGEPVPGDEDGIDIDIEVDVGGVQVTIPVTFNPTFNDVSVPITINNEFIAEINLGGINFNSNTTGAGGLPTDLTPVLDAISDTRGDIEVFRAGAINEFTKNETNVNENQVLIEQASAKIDSLLPLLQRIGAPENLTIAGQTEICLSENVLPNNIFNALTTVAKQLRLMRQIECKPDAPRTLLGVLTSTLESRVGVFSIPDGCRFVEIRITNLELPSRLSTYFVSALEGVNAKFGFANIAYSSTGGNYVEGIPSQLWTTRTFLVVNQKLLSPSVRVLLEPEISCEVYDSGIR